MSDQTEWPEDRLNRTSTVIGALDSPLRLKILVLLQAEPHVVHQLVEVLNKSQPLVSQHLRVLKNAGLVDATRSGREVIYTLATPAVIPIIEALSAIADGDNGDELAARRALRGPDFRDASSSGGASAAFGPLTDQALDLDPGLLPSTNSRSQ